MDGPELTPSDPAFAKVLADPALARELDRQMAAMLRGAVDLISEGELRRKVAASLAGGRPLRVKLGVDPTASMLHLGFTVVLNKLRAFQDLGHQAVLIIGDATALLGDPSGRNKTRPRLTPEEVDRNAAGYLEQAGKVLDLGRLELRRNGEWLKRLDFAGMIELASRYTVARMLERNDFQERYRGGVPIAIHELLYPLLQGYDSVQVRADVELGGTDQLFNLLVGRTLQEQAGQDPQVCLTTPLLLGLDGQRKMSKSFGNTIGIDEPPAEMFMKIMRIDDGMMRDYFLLATRRPVEEIERLLGSGQNPRVVKEVLGRTIVAMYHGEGAAEAAAEAFRRRVSEREVPDDAPLVPLDGVASTPEGYRILDVIMAAGFARSRGEARRLVEGGAVSVDDARIADINALVALKGGEVLRVGRQKVGRIRGPA